MATIRFVSGQERVFVPIAERVAGSTELQKAVDGIGGEVESSVFEHHAGSSTTPRLFEVQFPPNSKVEAHAHDVDEIIAVVEGEVRFGRRSFGVGSSIYIPKETLYSFQVGSQGATMLNFRPSSSEEMVISKEELMARKRLMKGDGFKS